MRLSINSSSGASAARNSEFTVWYDAALRMESAASGCLPIRSNSPERGLKIFWKCMAQFSAPVSRPK